MYGPLLLLYAGRDEDDASLFLEATMEFPVCPVCNEGRLLPFSEEKKAFALWICSLPACAYAISRNVTARTYYKGTASSQEKEK